MTKFALLVGAATLMHTLPAEGQTGKASAAVQLPEVIADGRTSPPPPAYRPGNGADSGTSRVDQAEVQARTPGSGDVNQLLKILPTVQFGRDEGLATREDIQDIRPADISISGGRIYDNLFTLDGVDMSSRLDTTQTNAQNFNEVAGASPQSLWLDANLIGAVTLRDSNVSAEYGRFTGGALDVETRKPRPVLGGSATVSYTADGLTNFKVADGSRDSLKGVLPATPTFEKIRYGATLDVPLSDAVQTLFAVNRSQADVTYFRNANYGGRPFGQRSRSDNFLAKVNADLSLSTTLSGQIAYTPYESQSSSAAGTDNLITSHGGGVTGQVTLARRGNVDWSVRGSIAHSRTDRDAQPFNYSIPSSTPTGAFCAATNCTIGGFGDLTQRQTNYGLLVKAAVELGPGRLSAGIDLQRIDTLRVRPEDGRAYQTGDVGTRSNVMCASPEILTCVTGEYALTRYQLYKAYRADVSLDSVGAWTEYRLETGAFDVRAGVRYDYESYLGNHNIAPRFSAAYTMPGTPWTLTLGANRYYGRSMLAYALKEQYPDSFTYARTPTIIGGRRIYADNWTLSATGHATSYSGSGNLRTPYSDELSAALSAPLLGGTMRLRGIDRRGEDELTRSTATTVTTTLANGRTTTYSLYGLTNEGFSRYRGGSIEWQRSFGRHTLALNTNFSKTSTSNADYLVAVDDLLDDSRVAFEGSLYTLSQIAGLSAREDYSSPFMVNGTWTSRWWRDRIITNVNLRYRDPFRIIQDTGRTVTIDGGRYDEYAFVRVPASIDANLNVQAELLRNDVGALSLDLRIANLFDTIPVRNATATAQPYQFGRSVWTGLSFRF